MTSDEAQHVTTLRLLLPEGPHIEKARDGRVRPRAGPRPRTVTRTIRVSADVDSALRRAAEREGVSTNLLINRALGQLLRWDLPAEKFGFVSLPTKLLARMISTIPDEEVAALGAWAGQTLAKEFVQFWFGKASLETVVLGLRLLGSEPGPAFAIRETVDRGETTLVINTPDPKWAIFHERLLAVIFEEVAHVPCRVSRTESQVTVAFRASAPPSEGSP